MTLFSLTDLTDRPETTYKIRSHNFLSLCVFDPFFPSQMSLRQVFFQLGDQGEEVVSQKSIPIAYRR